MIEENIQTLNIFSIEIQYIIQDNTKLQIKTFDNCTKNYFYNEVENHNKSPLYFLTKLKNIIEQKGHIFNHIEKMKLKKILHMKKILINNTMKFYILKIYLKVHKKKNNERSRIEKIEALKYHYLYKLGL